MADIDEKLTDETIVAWNGVIGTEWRRKDFKSPAWMTTPIEYVPLARLTAEREAREKAERERDVQRECKKHARRECEAAEAKLTAAEAEAARLREALLAAEAAFNGLEALHASEGSLEDDAKARTFSDLRIMCANAARPSPAREG